VGAFPDRGSIMREFLLTGLVMSLLVAGQGAAPNDPARTLSETFQFSPEQVAQAAAGQPIAKLMQSSARDELAVAGALRLDGDSRRLVAWVRDIAAFRKAAELGHATVVQPPISEATFAGFTADPRDVSALQACTKGSCDIRLSESALQQLQTSVHWDGPQAATEATKFLRQILAGYLQAYLSGGDAALGMYHNRKEPRAAADDFRALLAGATNLKLMVPELAEYLEKYPNAKLTNVDQVFYWTMVTDAADPIVSLHHLVLYPRAEGQVLIADKTIYASRSIDAAALVLAMQTAADGHGFYVMGAARIKSAKLSGVAARVLRSRIEKESLEGVQTYLGWIRDSLALAPAAPHP
jgi:hypothetical protein